MLTIKTIKVGIYETNCYLLRINQNIIIIDPGSKPDKIKASIANTDKVLAILITHGHFDHIGALDNLYDTYKCPVYLHDSDKELLIDARLNYSLPKAFISKVKTIDYPNILDIDDFHFNTIHAPGHTAGSMLLFIDKYMFSGDVLFRGDVGRTDLLTSNNRDMQRSLQYIKTLSKDYEIYPGHEEKTTLYSELKTNTHLK
jgi:hydroxyacylglutathione hydrolase